MSANFYELLKYAATGQASPSMTYFDKMRASTLMGGVIQTLTGIPPLSFPSDGSPITVWSMIGNGEQTGTPTPDSPVMPTFCGVRTGNLVNPDAMINGYHINPSGEMAENARRCTTPIFRISGTQATLSFSTVLADVHALVATYANGEMLNRTTNVESGSVVDISQADSIAISFYSGNTSVYVRISDLKIMLNLGSTALPYEPFGWEEKITCAGQTVPVYLGQVSTVRRIHKMRLLNPSSTTQTATGYRLTFSVSGHRAPPHTSGGGFCNIAKWQEDYNKIGFVVSNTSAFITQNIPEWATKEGATQWLEENEVYIWYVLANEETGIVNEPLCKIGDYADELSSTDAAVTIPTAKGQNTLTVDTDLQPSEMTITFKG